MSRFLTLVSGVGFFPQCFSPEPFETVSVAWAHKRQVGRRIAALDTAGLANCTNL